MNERERGELKPETLKKWRNKHGITQEEAAKHFRQSVAAWRKWEQGSSRIPGILKYGMKEYDWQKSNHYVYKTSCELTGKYYIGMRSSWGEIEDDPYLGSGIWTKKMKLIGADLKKEVIKILPSREEALKYESLILKEINEKKDPLCMNKGLAFIMSKKIKNMWRKKVDTDKI